MAMGRHPQWSDLDLSDFMKDAALLVIDPSNGVLHKDGAQSGDGLWRRARAENGSLEKILRLVPFALRRHFPVAWLRSEYLLQHSPASALRTAPCDDWYQNRRWTPDQKAWEGALIDEISAVREEGDLDSVYTSFGNVFLGSPLLATLNTWRTRTLIICGYHMDHCVEQAARTARDFGFIPLVVGDCSGASDPADEESTLKRVDANWAPVIQLADIVD